MGQLVTMRRRYDEAEEEQYREKLRQAIQDRDRLLEEHPELRELQREIDRRMRSAGSFENRMAILTMMMRERLHALKFHLEILASQGKRLQKILEQPARPGLRLVRKPDPDE